MIDLFTLLTQVDTLLEAADPTTRQLALDLQEALREYDDLRIEHQELLDWGLDKLGRKRLD